MRNFYSERARGLCLRFVFWTAPVLLRILLRHAEERSGKLRLAGTSQQEVVFSVLSVALRTKRVSVSCLLVLWSRKDLAALWSCPAKACSLAGG